MKAINNRIVRTIGDLFPSFLGGGGSSSRWADLAGSQPPTAPSSAAFEVDAPPASETPQSDAASARVRTVKICF